MNRQIIIEIVAVVLLIAVFSILYISNILEEKGEIIDRFSPNMISHMCEALCRQKLNEGQNLSNGPCLANPLPADAPNWVCDVAHNPRQEIDNLPENQCSAFGKTASHFIEVDENCNLIRTA